MRRQDSEEKKEKEETPEELLERIFYDPQYEVDHSKILPIREIVNIKKRNPDNKDVLTLIDHAEHLKRLLIKELDEKLYNERDRSLEEYKAWVKSAIHIFLDKKKLN